MSAEGTRKYPQKKIEYFIRMKRILSDYSKVFVVLVDNVGSQQMNATRKEMRGTAEILMGKNTLMKKVLAEFLKEKPGHFMANIERKMCGNVGFVFTNSDLPKVRDMILRNRVPAPARVGSIAPVEVNVPAGPTGADPGQTSFFQVLQIPTKIVKGQIEITNEVKLIKKGDKVGSSEAALLQKLNIKPFSYGFGIDCIYDNGACFSVDVLDIDNDILTARFGAALKKVASISLAIGYPTQASIPHSIGNAFKSLVAITVNLDNYSFPKAKPFKDYLADPSAFACAAPAAAPSSGPAPAAAPAKPKEEEVDALDGGMDMFGGGGISLLLSLSLSLLLLLLLLLLLFDRRRRLLNILKIQSFTLYKKFKLNYNKFIYEHIFQKNFFKILNIKKLLILFFTITITIKEKNNIYLLFIIS